MSDFDANGLLGMYPMHLLGTEQWRALLPWAEGARHLDVGAGSGDVTRTLRPLTSETVTTETSRVMARNLRRQGFRCFESDLARTSVPEPPYGLITCLNVIDRCARPVTLLERLARALSPGGTLVIATPFPFDPFVYDGSRSLSQDEKLDIDAAGPQAWERSVSKLAAHVRARLGLSVEALSRVPYLCQGDADKALYVLDDALLVCRSVDGAGPPYATPGGTEVEKSGQSR
jgi:SAM-dependent methyltransferase